MQPLPDDSNSGLPDLSKDTLRARVLSDLDPRLTSKLRNAVRIPDDRALTSDELRSIFGGDVTAGFREIYGLRAEDRLEERLSKGAGE